MMKRYNLQKVRKLLMERFTAEELEHFCRDMPDFNPVYDQLHQRTSVAEITQRILAYAEGESLMATLLGWVKERKPAEYEKYQPYEVELEEKYQPSSKEPPTIKPPSPPFPNRMYNIAKIRRLFTEGFTAEELEYFCRDMPDFKPVYYQLPQRASNVEIIVRLIDYAERKWLVEVLLDWAKEHNSIEYEKYQPYYVELEEKYQPSSKEPPTTKLASPPTTNKKPWWKFW
jgi:hypothetical protein